jgi:hypothetical protein
MRENEQNDPESTRWSRVATLAERQIELAALKVNSGLPSFTIVGLADRAIQEARERVKPAIRNAGFDLPSRMSPSTSPLPKCPHSLALRSVGLVRTKDTVMRDEGHRGEPP